MATPALLGNIAVFKIGATDLSGDGNNVKMSFAQDAHEATVFGNTWKEFIAGLASATIDFGGYYDYAANKVDAVLMSASALGAPGTPLTFTVNPVGGAASSGKPTYTGSMILTKYDAPDVKVNAPIVFAASFRVTGVVTRATL